MPQQGKKVFATIFSYSRHGGCGEHGAMIILEYMLLTGPGTRCGKCEVVLETIDDMFRHDLVEALVAHLNARYAPEVFHRRDVAGLHN